MIAVNFFGGAGIGKSTIAAEVFSKLKANNVNAELVGEMAKDVILQNDYAALEDQLWLFANQAHRMRGMEAAGVDVAVCDSPLLLNLVYGRARGVDDNQIFIDLAWLEHYKYDNVNFVLQRQEGFWKQSGRADDVSFALNVDKEMIKLLQDQPQTSITPFDGDVVVDMILKKIQGGKYGKLNNAKEDVA